MSTGLERTAKALVEWRRRASAAEAEVARLRAALQEIEDGYQDGRLSAYGIAAVAMVALREEVSEPGVPHSGRVSEASPPGSLTSPVDTAPGAKP